ncbi:MAG TPA: response regulator [Terriglobales bacterium]|nr:response regulator [Terriglobales bacterium]
MATLKVLVVEDDPASLELLSELLQHLDVEVQTLASGQEAPDLIRRESFDAIFLDLNLPVMTGFDLARLIRESVPNQHTPIVIVTGQDEQDTMYLSFSVGATYFLQKPINKQRVAALLGAIQSPLHENRRRAVRVPLNTQVTCTVGSRTLEGITWNISQGGIQVEVYGLHKGDNIRLSLLLPQPTVVISAQEVVVWSQDERLGLYFTEMSLEDQEALRTYIKKSGQ